MMNTDKCPCGCALMQPRHDSRDTAARAMTLWKRLEPTLWGKAPKRQVKRKRNESAVDKADEEIAA